MLVERAPLAARFANGRWNEIDVVLRVAVSEVNWPSNKTRNNALIPLRGAFSMAVEDEIIDRDPTIKLRNLKLQRPPVDPFSREEAEAIIKYLYDRPDPIDQVHTAYFEYAFFTGMRPNEILALLGTDIDRRGSYARARKLNSKGA